MYTFYIKAVCLVQITICLHVSPVNGESCNIEEYIGYRASRRGSVWKGVTVKHRCKKGYLFSGSYKRVMKAKCLGDEQWDTFNPDKNRCYWRPEVSKLLVRRNNTGKTGTSGKPVPTVDVMCKANFFEEVDPSLGVSSVDLYETDSHFNKIGLLKRLKVSQRGMAIVTANVTYRKGQDFKCEANQQVKGGGGQVMQGTMSGGREAKASWKIISKFSYFFNTRWKVTKTNNFGNLVTGETATVNTINDLRKYKFLIPTRMNLTGVNGKVLHYGGLYEIRCSALVGRILLRKGSQPEYGNTPQVKDMVRVKFQKVGQRTRELLLDTRIVYDSDSGVVTAVAQLKILSRFLQSEFLRCTMQIEDNGQFTRANYVDSKKFVLSDKLTRDFNPDPNEESEFYGDGELMGEFGASKENVGSNFKETKASMTGMILVVLIISR